MTTGDQGPPGTATVTGMIPTRKMRAGGRGRVLGGWPAAVVQAVWSVRRLVRGRMLWVAAFFALGPIAFTLLVVQSGRTLQWDELFAPFLLLCGIVPPLFMASMMAEEIEDRTYTYLWSRPLPRWSVLLGKLLAAVPLAAAVLCGAIAICYQIGVGGASLGDPWPAMALARGLGAGLAAAVVLSMVSGGIAILMPRHGIGVSYAYLLVLDLPLGIMPFSIAKLSVTHHLVAIAGAHETSTTSIGGSVLWMVGIGSFWLGLGLWRLARAEFSSGEK